MIQRAFITLLFLGQLLIVSTTRAQSSHQVLLLPFENKGKTELADDWLSLTLPEVLSIKMEFLPGISVTRPSTNITALDDSLRTFKLSDPDAISIFWNQQPQVDWVVCGTFEVRNSTLELTTCLIKSRETKPVVLHQWQGDVLEFSKAQAQFLEQSALEWKTKLQPSVREWCSLPVSQSREALEMFGQALFLGEYPALTERYYRNALEKDPDFSLAKFRLGISREEFRETDGALNLYQDALKNVFWLPVANNLATLLIEKGRSEEAVEVLKRGLSINPKHFQMRFNLVLANQDLKRYAIAEQILKDLIEGHPSMPELNETLGLIMVSQGKHEDARKFFANEIKLFPERDSAHFHLGLSYLQENAAGEAVLALGQAKKLNRWKLDYRLNLARALSRNAQVDEALTELQDLLKLKSDYEPALREYQRLKDLKRTIQKFQS